MKKLLLISSIFLPFTFPSFSQASNTWSVKFSDAMISRYSPTINAMTSKGWEYSNTIILHGMEKVYNNVTTPAYLNYIKAYADAYVNTDGTFKAGVTLVSLDRIHPGISLLFLYEKTGLSQYQIAAATLRNVLVGPTASYNPYRTPLNKIFWHKQTSYDNIMMLDGMYMAHPFLAKYGRLFGDNAAIDTAVNQTLFAYNQLYVSGTHLIKHAWKEPGSSGTVAWDDAAGNSTSVWSRAMGWYTMALVDILKYVPAAHPKRAQLLAALNNLAIGIAAYQDPSSHLWYHVVDKTAATLPGNYLETSGSAMFVYALKTASDSGWINAATYLPVAQNGWTGLQTKIDNYTDGKPRINDFSPAMSVQNTEALYVQASLQPVDCPVAAGTQHPHGYAAILMAASVMEFPLVTLPVKFISFSAKEYPDKIRLSWQNGDETDVDHYEIQRAINGNDFTIIGIAAAAGLSAYTFDDNAPESKTVFYRINAVYLNGAAHYSATIPVRKNKKNFEMKISPNPVQNGVLNILLTNITRGTYFIKVINNGGNTITTESMVVIDENNIVKTISLPATVTRGVYYVQLEGNGVTMNKSIIVK